MKNTALSHKLLQNWAISLTKLAKEEDKEVDINSLNKQERKELVKKLEKMQEASKLDFELFSNRDMMLEVKALD